MWFRRKRRSQPGMGPRAPERIERPNVEQQGKAMRRKPSNSRPRRQPSARSTAGMKLKIDVEKELATSSPIDTLSSGEQPHELDKSPYRYFHRGSREDITALPGSRELNTSPHLRPATQDNADIPYNFHLPPLSTMPASRTGPAKLQRSSSKRSAQDVALPKRKSTKRRKDDHVREEEIRAMSAPAKVGKRPSTHTSGILRRDSKRVRNGLNRRFERPESNVSLPMEDSIHSSMSGNSDPYSYHVSRFEVFAPRPILRTSFTAGLNETGWASQSDAREAESRARRKPAPSKDILKEKKTVSDLADNLGSSDLRAALERDRRRKEAKQQKETERLKRKLARKAEKQGRKEMGADGSPGKRKRRDPEKHVGLGIDSPQLTEVESPKRKKKDLEKHFGERVSNTRTLPKLQTTSDDSEIIKRETYLGYTRGLQLDTDLSAQPSSSLSEQLRLGEPVTDEMLATIHPAHRPSALSLGPEPELITAASSPKSKRLPPSPEQTPAPESPEPIEALPPLPSSPSKGDFKASRSGSRRSSRGLISFFRRGPSLRKRDGDRGRIRTPSNASFSNVSRESMSRSHLPPSSAASTSTPALYSATNHNGPALPVGRTGSASTTTTTSRQRDRSGTPVRTMSKFREDLPERSLSPQDSGIASPVALDSALTVRRGMSSAGHGKERADIALPIQVPSDSGSGSGSGAASLNNLAEDRAGKSSQLMSTSLASVDSEGSWLSGKPVKKHSVRRSARNSLTSPIEKLSQSPSLEEMGGMVEDDYFRRLSPPPDDRKLSGKAESMDRKASSTLMATPKIGVQDDEDELTENDDDLRRTSIQKVDDSHLKTGDVGRVPRLVHREQMVKSREGLLNVFEAHGSEEHIAAPANGLPSPAPESSDSDDAAPPPIRRFHPTEEIETPDPISPATDASNDLDTMQFPTPPPAEPVTLARASPAEPVTLARASSIKMKKEQMTPKLLDIPARRASGTSSLGPSELPTPRKLSRERHSREASR